MGEEDGPGSAEGEGSEVGKADAKTQAWSGTVRRTGGGATPLRTVEDRLGFGKSVWLAGVVAVGVWVGRPALYGGVIQVEGFGV